MDGHIKYIGLDDENGENRNMATTSATNVVSSHNTISRRGTAITSSQSKIVRNRTIFHPERRREKKPMIQPSGTRYGAPIQPSKQLGLKPEKEGKIKLTPWTIFSRIATILIPDFLINMFGIKGKAVIQAWREKVTLCIIVFFMSCLTVFFILFFSWRCSESLKDKDSLTLGTYDSYESVLIYDRLYETNTTYGFDKTKAPLFDKLPGGFDVTEQFEESAESKSLCGNYKTLLATARHLCAVTGEETCLTQDDLNDYKLFPKQTEKERGLISHRKLTVIWGWDLIEKSNNVFILDDVVINLTPYFNEYRRRVDVTEEDKEEFKKLSKALAVRDASRLFNNDEHFSDMKDCVIAKYKAGRPDIDTNICLVSKIVYVILITVTMGTLLARFSMAVYFSWFVSPRLCRNPSEKKVVKTYSRVRTFIRKSAKPDIPSLHNSEDKNRLIDEPSIIHNKNIDLQYPYTVLLVTCYSEGESSIRNTLDSLSLTRYPDERKLLFVVADGMITGQGNPKSTPDTIIDLIQKDKTYSYTPPLKSYIAIAKGSKIHNMARVYVGHYVVEDHKVPIVAIIKSGNDEERKIGVKAGNRGKRDSQLILMNFFSRVIMNDLMTPLDYDLFKKICHVSKVTPNSFEIVLMVDADTMVNPKSVKLMVNCMLNDPSIMGMCGETKIQNKGQSLVTMIQVFEYYISHHLGKAFESVFGGVTCLPGCFCMYRIKGIKDGKWVPLLMNSDIVEQYSSNRVDSLHQKNLLLLGEDRFLSTLMLRTFPDRKMVFAPKATCKTVVPDDFKTLLSQRRRWINSTVHNLMELVLVNNLCGTFCFSMQFIILLDLFSTAILPVSLCLLFYSIYQVTLITVKEWTDLAPLYLLLFNLLLPAVLVLFTSKKIHYIGWMIFYLIALPIWQIILPLYSFWHFDDFSWGETRKVDGEKKGAAHGGGDGVFDPSSVRLEKWETYEYEWKKALERTSKEIQEKRNMVQQPTPQGYIHTPVRGSSNNVMNNGNYYFPPTTGAMPPTGMYNTPEMNRPPQMSQQNGTYVPERISSVNILNPRK